ncbi:hypothetical protein G6F36_013613 [Rhizopus arrhizus]|nr:hypothetical protein G6F36_013613 [Rhizopus arrhizus]
MELQHRDILFHTEKERIAGVNLISRLPKEAQQKTITLGITNTSDLFYHYLPSDDFACDQLDTEEPEYQPEEVEVTINTLYRLDILISSEEEEESLDIVMDTEELGLGLARLPTMVWTLTKKVVGAAKRKAPEERLIVPKGTTGEHYLQLISDTMEIMDEFSEMKGYFIVMDNAPIHALDMIDPVIEKRGRTPVYLPPYSPELNPIEQFWAIIKGKVKRTKLSDLETLTSRIIEVSEAVPIVHLQNITQHSINQFEIAGIRSLLTHWFSTKRPNEV